MPGRKYQQNGKDYRYSINGQEKDKELNENITTAEFWEYDSRTSRRWNVDPVSKSYESPFCAFANNPINLIDPNGADTINITKTTTRTHLKGNNNSGNTSTASTASRVLITQSGDIVINQAKGDDVFRITEVIVDIDENGNKTSAAKTVTLELNNPQNFYRSGGHNVKGYFDDRAALAAHAPRWLLEYYNNKAPDIGLQSAMAYQSDMPFVAGLNKIMNVAYTISGAYGIFRLCVSRLAFSSFINLASRQRTIHILAGDATGGGHSWFSSLKSFTNGLTGSKSMFPVTWSEDKIMHAVSDVSVNNPWIQISGKVGAQYTKSGAPVRYAVQGYFEGVQIKVITTADDIITAFPIK